MSDDLKNRSCKDRARISLSEDHEVRYSTKAILTEAVKKVGSSAEAVKRELGK
jgi:Protein of unknown function (DUF3606)